jgi:hypothetical protein
MRAAEGWFGLGVGLSAFDLVADAGGVLDDVGFSELAAEPCDGDAGGVGERVGVLIPRLLQEAFCA